LYWKGLKAITFRMFAENTKLHLGNGIVGKRLFCSKEKRDWKITEKLAGKETPWKRRIKS